MFKKIGLLIAFFAFTVSAYASLTPLNYSSMNPTVKVVSYKKTHTDQVLAYGSGSGTLISSGGYILTNHHVVFDEEDFKPLDAFEICITFETKQKPVCQYMAQLVDHDPDLDIALLKLVHSDIFDQSVPALKFLSYQVQSAPKEESEVTVLGYPGSGGETITITKGQVSGFEEFNDYNYFKTDTDFDHGSSGGTAINSRGEFIGIPTYIRSYAENVGFFLDLSEAQSWIEQALKKSVVESPRAEKALKNELQRFKKANQNLVYTQEKYPYAQLNLPTGWEFLEISDTGFYASQKNASKPVGLSVQMLPYLFSIDEAYLNRLNEELLKIKKSFSDYQKEEVIFAGQKAWRVSYTSLANKNITYYIPYGYQLIVIRYSLDLNELESQGQAIERVLGDFELTKFPQNNPEDFKKISLDHLFSVEAADDWRLMISPEKRHQELLVEGVEKNNFDGHFRIYYQKIPKDQRGISAEDRLKDISQQFYGEKLVYKNEQVQLGGLKGFLYTYEYEGDEYQKIRKNLTIHLLDGDDEFLIEYDDLTDAFDRSLPSVKKILNSLYFSVDEADLSLENDYGNLDSLFADIQYHPYALAISELANKGIIEVKENGFFGPEDFMTRAEALKWILKSKNQIESEKKSNEVIDFSLYEKQQERPLDVNRHKDRSYVYYAADQGLVESKSYFRPSQTINLAEALKIILLTYDIPLWKGDTAPWFKKYMDKGFELRLIPYGMYDPSQPLTRGALAHLIYGIYEQAK